MRPFLLITTRADDLAAEQDRAAFVRRGGLADADLLQVRAERDPIPEVDLDAVSGVILAGSPYTSTDPEESKNADQRRVEQEVDALLDRVVAADTPFLGACYGTSTLGRHRGGVVDRRFAETVAAVPITLTADGRADPVFGALPAVFDAYVGHKEAVSRLPAGAVLLATGDGCPVQAFRVGRNQYATQFHPELDAATLEHRLRIYADDGYFPPDQLEPLIERLGSADVAAAHGVIRAFVERYAR